MSSELMPMEIFDNAENHRQKARELMSQRLLLQVELQKLIDGGASLADINAKKDEISELNERISSEIRIAVDLDTVAIRNILVATDVPNAMQAINCATEKVTRAVENIKTIRRVLVYIDLFIRIGSAIVAAAATGSPPAQIKAIIQAIDILYQTDFSDSSKDGCVAES